MVIPEMIPDIAPISARNFASEQPDRFVSGDFDTSVAINPRYARGSLHWTGSLIHAQILVEWEKAEGYDAALLVDVSDSELSGPCVVSSRPHEVRIQF